MPTVIKCVVPDKRVVEVVRLLKPFALDPPVVDPIDDGLQNSAIPRPKGPGFKELVNKYIDSLLKAGKKTVTTGELKALCVEAGGQDNSYSYPLKEALKAKRVRKTKDTKTYEVVK